jgi:hypothetical protein
MTLRLSAPEVFCVSKASTHCQQRSSLKVRPLDALSDLTAYLARNRLLVPGSVHKGFSVQRKLKPQNLQSQATLRATTVRLISHLAPQVHSSSFQKQRSAIFALQVTCVVIEAQVFPKFVQSAHIGLSLKATFAHYAQRVLSHLNAATWTI